MGGLIGKLGKGAISAGNKLGKGLYNVGKFAYGMIKEGVNEIQDYAQYKKSLKNFDYAANKNISKEDLKDYLEKGKMDNLSVFSHKNDFSSYLNFLNQMYFDKKISKRKHKKLKNTLYEKIINSIEEYNSPQERDKQFWRKISAVTFLFFSIFFFVLSPKFTGNVISENNSVSINILGAFFFLFALVIFPKRKRINEKELKSLFT